MSTSRPSSSTSSSSTSSSTASSSHNTARSHAASPSVSRRSSGHTVGGNNTALEIANRRKSISMQIQLNGISTNITTEETEESRLVSKELEALEEKLGKEEVSYRCHLLIANKMPSIVIVCIM
jgi:hypothetical protein